MTEGNGHVIDPAGVARRALQAAVAEHGPQALSNADIMDAICRDRLAALPGEAILIGSAARTDVPALLRERVPQLGNYGAIQSVAATLAEAHGLDITACLWVVREFARALGTIAAGGTQPRPASEGGTGTGAGAGAGTPSPGPAGPPASAGPPTVTAGGVAGGMAGGGAAAAGMAGSWGAGPSGGAGPGGGAGGGPWLAGGVAPGAGGAGVAGFGGWPGGPGVPGGGGPPAGGPPAGGARGPNRNALGIAAAIALVAVYLGIAAAAHLSPFPAKTVASASSQGGAGQGSGASPTPDAAPDASPDAAPDPAPDTSPPSAYDTLLGKIPSNIQGESNCSNIGTQVGATAVGECSGLQGLAAVTIYYYLFPNQSTLSSGFSAFLTKEGFHKGSESCTSSSKFVDFVDQCEDDFTNVTPAMTGDIAEYVNKTNNPIIVTTDNQQLVMAVMIGTNDADLLTYWKDLQWVVT